MITATRTNLSLLAIFSLGMLFRFFYLFWLHPAQNYLIADMWTYSRFENFFSKPSLEDTLHPPLAFIFFWILKSFPLIYAGQFVISVGICLLMGAIAEISWGRRAAKAALLFSSLYFPFVGFASYLLSENLFTFLLLGGFYLLIKSTQIPRPNSLLYSASWGLFSSLACATKTLGLLPFVFCGVFLLRKRFYLHAISGFVFFGLAAIPFSLRCTKLQGRFCLFSTGYHNVLIGHLEQGSGAVFKPHLVGPSWLFYNHARVQKDMAVVTYRFSILDSKSVMDEIRKTFERNPLLFLKNSLLNLWHLFRYPPWPLDRGGEKNLSFIFHVLFCFLLILIAMLGAHRLFVLKGSGGAFPRSKHPLPFRTKSRETSDLTTELSFAMVLGLFVTVFVSYGESRYRIPFDPYFVFIWMGLPRASSKLDRIHVQKKGSYHWNHWARWFLPHRSSFGERL